MSVAAALGQFVAETATRDFDAEVDHHAIRALIDWTGATIAGWRAPQSAMLLEAVRDEVGGGAAQVFAQVETTASARTAALLNGTASHVVEMDDIYAPALYHPGCPTIAAALAASQASGATGADLLRAITIGYEVGNRIGAAVQPSHYRYWHTTGTVGCFGAAAAASVVLGLNAVQSGHALATAATFAAGLQQAFRSDSMSKPLHAGRAAEAGLFAAQCARRGLTGEAEIFEGAAGFGEAMSDQVDWRAMLAALGTSWTVTQMTHKDHACCGHAFPAIDGALALREAIGSPDNVRRIFVETYSTAVNVAGVLLPTTPFEAKFSIPFVIATAMVYGCVRLDAFTPERVGDRALQTLLARVELEPSARYDMDYPAMRGASVTIELTDGRSLRHDQPTRRGSPSSPMSDAELDDKFVELAAPTLRDAGAKSLLAELHVIKTSPETRLQSIARKF